MIKFVNRKKELEFLKDSFEYISGKNLIIVYGKMGVGKSELVKQFLSCYAKCPAIKVPISRKAEFESGYYLKKIKEWSNSPINGVLFRQCESDYIFKQCKTKLPLKFLFNIIEVIPIIKEIFQVLSKSYKEYRELKVSLKYSSGKRELIQTEDYLQYLYSEMPFILNIENIQLMDEFSWNSLYNILCNAENYSLIFEYTPDENATLQITEILNKYSTIIEGTHIKTIEIKKLDKKHVLSIDETLSSHSKQHLEEELKDWDGNLKEIENYLILNRYKKYPHVSNNTETMLNLLEPKVLDWLMKIYISAEEVSISWLQKLGLSDDTYNTLLDAHLIKEEKGHISTDHDSICNVLNDNKFILSKKKAIKYWSTYYQNKYYVEQDTHCIYGLIYFTVLLDDINELNKLLGTINNNIMAAAEPKEYLKRVERIYYKNAIKTRKNNATETILFWLVEMYQNLGDYKKAYSFLNNIENKSTNRYIILKALLLYQAGFQENAVKYCTKVLENTKVGTHMELLLRTIRLEANYTLEEYQKTKAEYYYIEKNSNKFEKYLEYGFFLRNAELVKLPADAIVDFEKSIAHFEKFKAKKQTISSRINLAVAYGLLGKFDKARLQLKIAYSKKEEFIGLYDMILNNQAVLLHYEGNSPEIKEKLLLALKYASYDFNKLAICNNLLVYNIRAGIEDNILIEEMLHIIKNRTFKNKRIIHFVYINLYRYYQGKNEKLSLEYYNKIFKLDPLPYYFNEWLDEPTLSSDDPEYYRTRVKWPLSYLNEWSIEYDSSLMHFQ